MDLQMAAIKTIRLMNEHGLIEAGWRVDLDRAQRRFGLCSHWRKLITISAAYIQVNEWDNDPPSNYFGIKDTVLHEIAHALIGPGHGHDFFWRMKCSEIGCDPTRCVRETTVRPAAPYVSTCPTCGQEFRVYRKGKHFKNYRCGRCRTALTFVNNPNYQMA